MHFLSLLPSFRNVTSSFRQWQQYATIRLSKGLINGNFRSLSILTMIYPTLIRHMSDLISLYHVHRLQDRDRRNKDENEGCNNVTIVRLSEAK
jgi:hypothetical protein